MNVSKLIAELQRIQAETGDRNVTVGVGIPWNHGRGGYRCDIQQIRKIEPNLELVGQFPEVSIQIIGEPLPLDWDKQGLC